MLVIYETSCYLEFLWSHGNFEIVTSGPPNYFGSPLEGSFKLLKKIFFEIMV